MEEIRRPCLEVVEQQSALPVSIVLAPVTRTCLACNLTFLSYMVQLSMWCTARELWKKRESGKRLGEQMSLSYK